MSMVHDTEIDAVNSIFSTAAAVVAMQTCVFPKQNKKKLTNQNKRAEASRRGKRTSIKQMTRSQIQTTNMRPKTNIFKQCVCINNN